MLSTLMGLIIIIFGLFSIGGIKSCLNGINEVYEGSVDAIASLNQFKNMLQEEMASPIQKLDQEFISANQAIAALNQWQATAQTQVDHYAKTYASNANYQQKASELLSQVKSSNAVIAKLTESLKEGNRKQLKGLIQHDFYPMITALSQPTEALIDMHVKETQDDYQSAVSNAHTIIIWLILGIATATLLIIVLATLISNSILTPLASALKTVDRVTLGDTSVAIEIQGSDESARLMQAMQKMNDSTTTMTDILTAIANGDLSKEIPLRCPKDTFGIGLNTMIDRLRQIIAILQAIGRGDLSMPLAIKSADDTFGKGINSMIDGMQRIISEIQSEVNVLSNSTNEIVSSVNQVSAGTAETAAAVTETTASVEEVKQTAQISTDKAKDVLANAEESLKIVKSNEKTLLLTIDEMKQIQEKMNVISASIIKLSEHSLMIGEIITSVNGLAEQSNLLAVNAAIEAAKAGDQGKSFGVVAQEIRALAEQSKEATVQVRALLNDIQNATSAAVLATEQGSKAVTKGVVQSSQMSESIHLLSTSISRFAQAANQIAISSQQQLVGVDQVTVAMSNINDASNQHVEHMRQIETSITSLNAVTKSLKELVSQYKLRKQEAKHS
jgi:methyl-accepting chemotaxis protein